jgi:hypothetical protein
MIKMADKYVDLDKGQEISRLFSNIEKQRLFDILDTIDNIFTEYHTLDPESDNRIIEYLPGIETCECGQRIVSYHITLKEPVLFMEEIDKIKESLGELRAGLSCIGILPQDKPRLSLIVSDVHNHDEDKGSNGDGERSERSERSERRRDVR